MLRDRSTAAAGVVLGDRFPRARHRGPGGREFKWAVDALLVVDGAGYLDSDVVVLERPTGRHRLLVAVPPVDVLPLVDDLMADHPILVGGGDGHQVDPAPIGHR